MKKFQFKTLIGEILNIFVLHFSVWEDLWPYCNAYVRPGTRAKGEGIMPVNFTLKLSASCLSYEFLC